jgi:hypothetical protein
MLMIRRILTVDSRSLDARMYSISEVYACSKRISA